MRGIRKDVAGGWLLVAGASARLKLQCFYQPPSTSDQSRVLLHSQILPRHLLRLLDPENPEHRRRDILQRAIRTQLVPRGIFPDEDERNRIRRMSRLRTACSRV